MGALIAVIGNTAAGKTTLVKRLAATAGFVTGLEQHVERPFQRVFAADLRRFALANQIDYLLLRAEQEQAIRRQPGIGLVDGGLDEDFYIFTRHFFARGYLDAAEFELCVRFFRFIRSVQPEPDLYLLLQAPISVLVQRYSRRGRPLEIATVADLERLQDQVDEWARRIPAHRLVCVDASGVDAFSPAAVAHLTAAIHARLG